MAEAAKWSPQKGVERVRQMNLYLLRVFCFILLLVFSRTAAAAHKVGHCRPPLADVAFPSDFPVVQDQEWGSSLGGWGGPAREHPSHHHPVIFVHGNTGDAGDWDEPGRSVKKHFVDAGYSVQELWALSYNGKATKQSPQVSRCYTDNQANVPDLTAFVKAVLDYTAAAKVDIIAHSLGVTIARSMLVKHPKLSQVVEDFVAIAGPNHGTTVCRRLWLFWVIGWNDFVGCNELVPGSDWLRSLNGPQGEREAPGPTRFMTIYDGTGSDIFYSRWLFWLPVRDQDSPALKGAKNVMIRGLTHDELRTNNDAVSIYLRFVQQ